MARVKIYTWTVCPYCVRAKDLLKRKNIAFEEVNLDGKDEELIELRERTGQRTLPQIFIDERLIGGFTELAAMDAKGDLESYKSAKGATT